MVFQHGPLGEDSIASDELDIAMGEYDDSCRDEFGDLQC